MLSGNQKATFKTSSKGFLGLKPPQVRLKMNDKKPSKFQFYFSRVLEAFSMLKNQKIFCYIRVKKST